MDGEWGDWIALWGLINMLEIPVAIVSSLGETGLNVIYPADYQNEAQATGDMALLGHEAELHYHSLEPMASQKPQLALVQELKEKYGEGKITEEICPKCGRQFECYTRGAVRDHLRSWDHLRTRTGPGNLENKRRGSRGIPGRYFRCGGLTPLFEKQIKSIFALSHITSIAVLFLDSKKWIPLRNRLLIILYNKGIDVKIPRALVNSICC